MTNKEIISYVFSEAAKSNIEKRKVGCIIACTGTIVGKGFNSEDYHAEVAAVDDYINNGIKYQSKNLTVYVSQQPCPNCAEYILDKLGPDTKIEVVKEFIKFDGDKLRYDLVPPSAVKALAEVLTFGARKYKPNNWKNCENPERYLAALYRHLELWRAGEVNDSDSGMHHLAHALTNIAFMLELNYNPTEWSNNNESSTNCD